MKTSPNHTSFFDKLRAGRLAPAFTVLAALSVGILAGSVMTGHAFGKEAQQASSADARPLTIPSPVTLSNGFSQIVKQVGPAVVNIDTEELPKAQPKAKRRGQGNGDDQQSMQDFMRRFFGGQGGQGGEGDEDGQAGPDGGDRRALGSGFIVDPRGYIITNNHVVDKADRIYVKLANDPDALPGDPGRPAKVIGVDKETDIAVIKIESKDPLPTVKLGNSEGTQVGDWVLAIGTPFGQRNTVSAGIVSAKGREFNEVDKNGLSSSQFQRFIQTDAAINPGNSGGPLVDLNGSVIGMNTAIFTQSNGSEGIGFAIPSNTIINVYNMLISPDHKVTRGSIGVTFQAATSSAVGRVYGFQNGGVIVNTVTAGGGAAKAGIQPGDVLVSIDGRNIKDGDDLVADISARHVGSNVKIGYLRNGKPQSASVTIGDRAKTYTDLAGNVDNDSGNAAPDAPDMGQATLGITVTAVPPQIASKLKVTHGVMVTSVRSGSFADDISLTKGTVIVEINRQPVTDEASYRAIVNGLHPGSDVVFVLRDGRPGGGNSYVGGTLP